jgi:hypothetical protein
VLLVAHMGQYYPRSRSKGELKAIAYRAFLYLIVPVSAILPACGKQDVGYPCPDIISVVDGPTLIYPIPNATGVPTTPSDLVFSSLPLLPNVTTSLAPATDGTGVPTLQLGAFIVAPLPIPSPAASYAPSTKLYAVAYPALTPKTTYNIVYSLPRAGPCSDQTLMSSGSFSTSYRFSELGGA